MGSLSPMHWLVVIAVVLIFFGPKRIPELAKGLGKGIREFKSALNGEEEEAQKKAELEKKNKTDGQKTA